MLFRSVISDTVNTAYRIMEYAKSSNLPVVVSLEVVKNSLNKNKSIKYERIGEIAVKGKKELVAMYSCQYYNAAAEEEGAKDENK